MIKIVGDLGASGSKILAWNSGAKLLLKPPQVAPCNLARLQKTAIKAVNAAPEDNCVVEYAGRSYAVGTLARKMQGSSAVELPKKDRAVIKLLAALGLQWEVANSGSTEADASLAVLLPLDEFWIDRQSVREQLIEATRDFHYGSHRLRVKMRRLELLPEGAGLYLAWFAKVGQPLNDKSVVILLCGHRNASLLNFDRGQPIPENSSSRGPGFIKLLEQLVPETPGISADNPVLLETVVADRYEIILPGRKEPVALSKEFLDNAKNHYWQLMEEFLLAKMPQSVDLVLVAGGAAYQIAQELNDFLKLRGLEDRTVWIAEKMAEEMREKLGEKDPLTLARACDVYGTFKWLLKQQ